MIIATPKQTRSQLESEAASLNEVAMDTSAINRINNLKPPDKKCQFDSYTTKTDLSHPNYNHKTRAALFDSAVQHIESARGQMSTEMKKIVKQMSEYYKASVNEINGLRATMKQQEEQIERLQKENNDLKSNPVPAHASNSPTYAQATKNKQEQFVVVVKPREKAKPGENQINLKRELFAKLRPVERDVDIINSREKNGSLVVFVKNKEQQEIVNKQLENNPKVESSLPTKRIPSIIIKEVDPSYSESDILDELEAKENVNRSATTIRVILKNPKFKTNRVIINFNKEDTVRIAQQGAVKLGPVIHPIELDYRIIQCKNCNGFGHFHKSKDGAETICKSKKACVHCSKEHDLNDCPHKTQPQQAKCSGCNGNHRAYDKRCPKWQTIISKVKPRFII